MLVGWSILCNKNKGPMIVVDDEGGSRVAEAFHKC